MRIRTRQAAMLTLGGLLALVLPAGADLIENCGWDHPCDASNLTCDCSPCFCWCQAQWDISANWLEIQGDCIGYPDTPIESALIQHSNTGYCSDGTRCSQDTDCTKPTRPCEDYEMYLLLDLITATIDWLDVTTKSTNATNDDLSIHFESKDPGNKTLTVGRLFLNATQGPITIMMQDGATLKTDTTD